MDKEKLFAYAVPMMIYIVISAVIAGTVSIFWDYQHSDKLSVGFIFGLFIVAGYVYYKRSKDE